MLWKHIFHLILMLWLLHCNQQTTLGNCTVWLPAELSHVLKFTGCNKQTDSGCTKRVCILLHSGIQGCSVSPGLPPSVSLCASHPLLKPRLTLWPKPKHVQHDPYHHNSRPCPHLCNDMCFRLCLCSLCESSLPRRVLLIWQRRALTISNTSTGNSASAAGKLLSALTPAHFVRVLEK